MTRCTRSHCGGAILKDYDGSLTCINCGRSPATPELVAQAPPQLACRCGKTFVTRAGLGAHRALCPVYRTYTEKLRVNGLSGRHRGWGKGTIAFEPSKSREYLER